VNRSPVSHLDILPTMLDLMGVEAPPSLHGVSLAPVLDDRRDSVREHVFVTFHRFAINHDSNGEFYPIRCVTDGRFKLAINLFESDEFYDLREDPHELHNLIDGPDHAEVRDRLHDALLAEMDRIRDPFRSFRWGDRSWRSARRIFYRGENRPRPEGFTFEPSGIDMS
jgi:uncharacterized sulfatase